MFRELKCFKNMIRLRIHGGPNSAKQTLRPTAQMGRRVRFLFQILFYRVVQRVSREGRSVKKSMSRSSTSARPSAAAMLDTR